MPKMFRILDCYSYELQLFDTRFSYKLKRCLVGCTNASEMLARPMSVNDVVSTSLRFFEAGKNKISRFCFRPQDMALSVIFVHLPRAGVIVPISRKSKLVLRDLTVVEKPM